MVKRRKKKPVEPNYVFWTRESQRRFQAAVDKFEELVACQANAHNDWLALKQHFKSSMAGLDLAVDMLRVMIEEMLKRSAAARKANETRKAHKADDNGHVTIGAIENYGTPDAHIVHPVIPPSNDPPADLVEVIDEETQNGG